MSLCWHVKLWNCNLHTAQIAFLFWGQNVEVVCWVSQNLNHTEVDAHVTPGSTSLFELQYARCQGLSRLRSKAQSLAHSLYSWGGGNEKHLCGSLLTHLPFLDGCHGYCSLDREWSSWGCLWAGRYKESMGSLSERKWEEKNGIVTKGERAEGGKEWGKIIC